MIFSQVHSNALDFAEISDPNVGGGREFKGLPEKAQVRRGISKVRQGWTSWADTQGAGCFSQNSEPIRFRAMRATHLRNLSQAPPLCFPGGVIHVEGWVALYFRFPFWEKTNVRKKREQNTGDKKVGARRGAVLQTILLAYPPNTKGTVLSMRMQTEFQCATCEPYSFQATPLSVRSWSGRNPPDPKRRRRGTISLRTLVKPPAGFSVPGSQYAFSKSPSSRARWMLKK